MNLIENKMYENCLMKTISPLKLWSPKFPGSYSKQIQMQLNQQANQEGIPDPWPLT